METEKQRSAADRALRRKYFGFSLADYERELKKQGGGCKICGRPPKTRRLHVDHDHKTKLVRGLLCHRCNRGLQMFGDDPQRLKSAAKYLENHVIEKQQRGRLRIENTK